MRNNTFTDFVMRLGLVLAMFCSAALIALTLWEDFGVAIEIAVPVGLFLWMVLTFFILWFMDQLVPCIEPICKIIFTYTNIRPSNESREWCQNNTQHFWTELNGTYYFLFKRDAMAFKLVWI